MAEGLCLLPTELLRSILLDVFPNDLIALAGVNRHLRHAVPACIDYALARRHVLAGDHVRDSHHSLPKVVLPFRYDHPLLFNHTVAEFAIFRIRGLAARTLWGNGYKPTPTDGKRREAIRLNRVNALRASIEKREWLVSEAFETPFGPTRRSILEKAAAMAAYMRSMDLLEALRSAFPDDISYDPKCCPFKRFLFSSADMGFCDGLDLIPPHHDILTEFHKGSSLLRLAFPHAHAVELLLRKGASPNLHPPPSYRKAPLLFKAIVIADRKMRLLRLLLQHGVDTETRDFNRRTALHLAADFGFLEPLKLLLEFGANIEARDLFRMTPLCWAAHTGQVECGCVLLNAGAKVHVTDTDGKTPLAFCSCMDTSVGGWDGPDHAGQDFDEVVRMLLEAGSPVDTVDQGEYTPLHHTLDRGRPVAARLLLDAGAAATRGCRHGSTALAVWRRRLAWSREWEGVLDRLVEGGADLWSVGSDGMTAWEKLREAGKRHPEWWRWMARHGELDEETRQDLDALE
ncbi:hypothetical protein HDU96_008087 [Phlyctochytrium bullatum]|nr:hypothetical protein HDU96_008087 [Phlyctochytrium bullatum]